jgi:hypothetical protein
MMILFSRKRRVRVLPLVFLLFPMAIGCGGQGKAMVSGKVTHQGKSLPSGIVTFVPEAGPPQHAEIQSDGTYHMKNAPLGPVKIGVQPSSSQDTPQSPGRPRNPKEYGKLQAAMTEGGGIPPKYNDPNKSELTYIVTTGQQQHDIDLK